MQHLGTRRPRTRSELHTQWGAIVEGNVERLWRLAIAAGLSRRAAAEVCQLVWLRLSQRLSQFTTLEQVARWLDDEVYREAGAQLRRVVSAGGQLADQRTRAGEPDSDSTVIPGHDLGAATAVTLAPRF
jgi:DNA-directed RNA polymerase specialized sigma24 family protein